MFEGFFGLSNVLLSTMPCPAQLHKTEDLVSVLWLETQNPSLISELRVATATFDLLM